MAQLSSSVGQQDMPLAAASVGWDQDWVIFRLAASAAVGMLDRLQASIAQHAVGWYHSKASSSIVWWLAQQWQLLHVGCHMRM